MDPKILDFRTKIDHETQKHCGKQQSGFTLTYGKLFFGERDGNLFEIFGKYLKYMLKNKFARSTKTRPSFAAKILMSNVDQITKSRKCSLKDEIIKINS